MRKTTLSRSGRSNSIILQHFSKKDLVSQTNQTSNITECIQYIEYLYNQYIRIGSPSTVNISHTERMKIIEIFEENKTELFNKKINFDVLSATKLARKIEKLKLIFNSLIECQTTVLTLLGSDTFNRFKRTKEFKQFYRQYRKKHRHRNSKHTSLNHHNNKLKFEEIKSTSRDPNNYSPKTDNNDDDRTVTINDLMNENKRGNIYELEPITDVEDNDEIDDDKKGSPITNGISDINMDSIGDIAMDINKISDDYKPTPLPMNTTNIENNSSVIIKNDNISNNNDNINV